MKLRLRPGTVADAKEWGRIQYEAFKSIGQQHNFLPDFPSVEAAIDLVTMLLSHPRFYSVVAELEGRIVGGNFLDERSTIAGIGPVSVDPPFMNSTIGRQLMQAVMDRASARRFPGVRLLQIACTTARSRCTRNSASRSARRSPDFRGRLLASESPAMRFGQRARRMCRRVISSVSVFMGMIARASLPMPFAMELQTSSSVWAGLPVTRRRSAGSITL